VGGDVLAVTHAAEVFVVVGTVSMMSVAP